MKRQLKYIFFIHFIIGSLISCDFNSEGRITKEDYPDNLKKRIDTIEVTYVAWACACANWLPTEFLEDPNYSSTDNADDCIYIEASNEKLKLPEEFELGGYNNRIRLIGSYYKEKGISRDYIQPTSQKPEKGKVFRYTEIEIIKPYTIWDFTTEEPTTRTIEKGKKTKFYKD